MHIRDRESEEDRHTETELQTKTDRHTENHFDVLLLANEYL